MTEEKRTHYRTLLEGERDRLHALLREAKGVTAAVAATEPGEESEPGVAGAAAVDDAAVVARQSAALSTVETTLRRLQQEPDQYGICAECGRPIAEGRLELIPTATRCARHAGAGE
jgi:RNA polymerase-binding transcription factor DksA